jgi:hypothetical protein
MARPLDLTSSRFGRLTVLRRLGRTKHHKVSWECLCDCGIQIQAVTETLRNGNVKSCGCLHRNRAAELGRAKLVELAGQRFGRLTVLRRAEINSNGKPAWVCLCDCGNSLSVAGVRLSRGNTRSCGCLRSENVTTHGHTRGGPSKAYRTWQNMIRRCHNPKSVGYHNYGGRGITVCGRWRESFVDFLGDMGDPPSEHAMIDRVDNNLGYEPGNCVWTSHKNNCRNKRNNRRLLFNGKLRSIAEIADLVKGNCAKIYSRIHYLGWSLERAIADAPGHTDTQNQEIIK